MKVASSLPFATLALAACAAIKSWTAALSLTTMTPQLKMMRTELPRSSFPTLSEGFFLDPCQGRAINEPCCALPPLIDLMRNDGATRIAPGTLVAISATA